MLKELFKVPRHLTGKQTHWLQCMVVLPAVKNATGKKIRPSAQKPN